MLRQLTPEARPPSGCRRRLYDEQGDITAGVNVRDRLARMAKAALANKLFAEPIGEKRPLEHLRLALDTHTLAPSKSRSITPQHSAPDAAALAGDRRGADAPCCKRTRWQQSPFR